MTDINGLKTQIEKGTLSAALSHLYGPGQVEFQKNRYIELLGSHKMEFSVSSAAVFSAPGRTEIGGNHTDHNLGKVLAAGVDLDTLGAATARDDLFVRIHSRGWEPLEVNLNTLEKIPGERESSAALVRGIARFLKDQGFLIGGFDCTVTSRVLPGSGLSSSASFEVLTASIFNGLFNRGEIPLTTLAQAGQYGENEFYGKPCGLMDQMACAHGGVIALDFRDPSAPEMVRISVDFGMLGYVLLVTNTPGDHRDLSAHYAAIPGEMKAVAGFLGKQTCRELSREELFHSCAGIRESLGDRAFLRAFHYLEENRRVEGQLAALAAGAMDDFLDLVNRSGRSSFQYLQNISVSGNPKSQVLAVALAMAEQALGGRGAVRVHGGGFAGTILAFVPGKSEKEYTDFMDGIFGKNTTLRISIRNHPAGMIAG